MTFKKLALCAALPFTMIACGASSSNDPVKNVQQANKDSGLQQKSFRGDCSLRLLDAVATGLATAGQAAVKSSREEFRFEGATVMRTTSLYSSADCSDQAVLQFKETGDFSIDDNQHTSDGGQNIDLHYKKLEVTSITDTGALIAKEVKLCGSEDWSAGTNREVNASAADVNCYRRKVPADDINVYKRDGNTLYFGSHGLTGALTTRPTSVDMQTKYVAE